MLRAVLHLGQRDCAPPHDLPALLVSNPIARGENLCLRQDISPPLILITNLLSYLSGQLVPSLQLHVTSGWTPTPNFFFLCLVLGPGRREGQREGVEFPPALPVAEAHGNTSRRFVASTGDFSLLCCTSLLRHSLFIVCPSNPGTVKAWSIKLALLWFMSCAWLTECYDSWDEIRLQVSLLLRLEHFQVSLDLSLSFRLRKSQRRKTGRYAVLLHPIPMTPLINGKRNPLVRKQRWKKPRYLMKVEEQCSFSQNKKLPDREKTRSHFPVHA